MRIIFSAGSGYTQPAVPAIVNIASARSHGASTLDKMLETLSASWRHAQSRISRSSVVYQRMSSNSSGIEFKTLGEGDVERLSTPMSIQKPRVSLDGESFYFMADVWRQCWILALTKGRAARLLVRLPANAGYYDVSPDGTRVAYQLRTDKYHIYQRNVRTSETIEVSDSKLGGAMPAYSPDGNTVAYCSRKTIQLRNLLTSETKTLAQDDRGKELPAWSPDGQEIVYQAQDGEELGYDLFKVNVQSGVITRLTNDRGNDINPIFTADGRMIVYTSAWDTHRGSPTLCVMNSDGTNLRRDTTAGNPIYFPAISSSAVIAASPGLEARPDAPAATEAYKPLVTPAGASKPVVSSAGSAAGATPPLVTAAVPATINGYKFTPTMNAPPAVNTINTVPAYTLAELMTMLANNQLFIQQALDGAHTFFLERRSAGFVISAKAAGQPGVLPLAHLPYSSLCAPHVFPARTAMCFKFVDQSAQMTYVLVLQHGQAPRLLAKLPLQLELSFENFDVAPDASRLVFDVRLQSNHSILSYDTKLQQAQLVLGQDAIGVYPSLSADGKRLVYISGGRLMLRDLATLQETVLVQDDLLKEFPSFSKDGGSVVYQAAEGTGTFDVYMVQVATGTVKRLTATNGDDLFPTFSADGSRILFTSERMASGRSALYSMALDGTGQQADTGVVSDVLFPK